MIGTHLPGLEGTNPLGFLAALGVQVAFANEDEQPRLWWSDDVTPTQSWMRSSPSIGSRLGRWKHLRIGTTVRPPIPDGRTARKCRRGMN